MRDRKLKGTAYHEAGHAVAAFALGRAVRRVSIIPDEDGSLGRCHYFAQTSRRFTPDAVADAWHRARLETMIRCATAGGVAEQLLTGRRPLRWGATEDADFTVTCAMYMTGDADELAAYIDWLWKSTTNLLRQPWRWAAVEALAADLLDRRELGQRRTRETIRAALGVSE
jgi:hypothetical protein